MGTAIGSPQEKELTDRLLQLSRTSASAWAVFDAYRSCLGSQQRINCLLSAVLNLIEENAKLEKIAARKSQESTEPIFFLELPKATPEEEQRRIECQRFIDKSIQKIRDSIMVRAKFLISLDAPVPVSLPEQHPLTITHIAGQPLPEPVTLQPGESLYIKPDPLNEQQGLPSPFNVTWFEPGNEDCGDCKNTRLYHPLIGPAVPCPTCRP